MNLEPKLVMWLAFSLLAVLILARMMDKRRAKLRQMLQGYVEARLQWAQKRAKATRLTQKLTREKAAEQAKEANRLQAASRQTAHSDRSQPGASTATSAGPSDPSEALSEHVKAA